MPPTQGAIDTALVLVLVGALLSGRVSVAATFGCFLAALLVTGSMTARELLALLVDPASVSVVCLVLFSTLLGRLRWLRGMLFSARRAGRRSAALRFLGVAGLVSTAMPNTAVVGAFMGPGSRHPTIKAHQLLLPLSYVALAGGMVTHFGTSATLMVVGQAVERGISVGFLDFAAPGLAAFGAVLAVLVLLGPWLLRERGSVRSEEQAEAFHIEARVQAGSPLIGRSLVENHLRNLGHHYLAEIVRGDTLLSPVHPTEELQAGDVLIFVGDIRYIDELAGIPGIEVMRDARLRSSLNAYHAVVAWNSALVGRTLKGASFRAAFDASVLAIRRGTERISGKLGEVELKAGDLLVIAGGSSFPTRDDVRANFHIVDTDEAAGATLSRRDAALVTLLFVGFFALVVTEALPFVVAAFLLVFIPLILGQLSPRELRRHFPFDLVVMLWGSLALGSTLTRAGLDTLIASAAIEQLDAPGALVSIAVIFLIAWILTELLSNVAAGVATLPIALQVAAAAGLPPDAAVLAVCFGASASFLMPYGYQTHLMVMSPGGYSLADFLRLGGVVLLTYAVAAIGVIWLQVVLT